MTQMLWTHDRLKPKNWKGKGNPTVIHAKYDGHRLTLFKQFKDSLKAFGRKVEEHLEMSEQLEHLEWFQRCKEVMPAMTSFDGELYVPGERASKVKNILINKPERLKFATFAVPYWDGHDQNLRSVEKVMQGLDELNIHRPEYMKPLGVLPDAEQLNEMAETAGIEGWVLKEHNYAGWWKVKREYTCDAIVIGFKDSESDKNIGLVGALHVGLIDSDTPYRIEHIDPFFKMGFGGAYDGLSKIDCPPGVIEIAAVAGMTDEIREAISDDDYGRVCEVKYQLVDGRGRLRHPRFIRWRDDKPRMECTKDQLDV